MTSTYIVRLVKGKVRWYYRIEAHNGQVISVSQKYYSKANAKRAAWRTGALLGAEVV